MIAEVIAIGDELTSGQRLDTNSQWISQRLGEMGIPVSVHATVGDDLAADVEVFRQAVARAEIVICTGGLGPTSDDLTREALAELTGRPLQRDDGALEHIRSLFARRRREMPPRNISQAMFPEGSRVIPNPHGTAPGIDLDIPRADGSASRLFALPGVPAEMREMWNQTVAPAIASQTGDTPRVIRHHSIKCYGVGESDLEQMLPDIIKRGRVPTVGITASRTTLTLRISAQAETEAACHDLMAPTIATIHESLGKLVFGEGDEELQDAVVRLLRQRGETLAVVEIGSGGRLAHWLSEADGLNKVFVGGTVVRRHPLARQAGQADIDEDGATIVSMFLDGVSPDDGDVRTAARLARRLYKADYGLAIGEFPASDSAETTASNVEVALDSADGAKAIRFPFAGHPDVVQHRTVKRALDYLRQTLLDKQPS